MIYSEAETGKITQCKQCNFYNKKKNSCTHKCHRGKWDIARVCPGFIHKLVPQYFYFKDNQQALNFADAKNKRAKVNTWVTVKSIDGYTVYNLRRELL